jgi:phosphoglycerate dehydrogenase-like enzyme
MQILMPEVARQRIAGRLKALGPDLEVLSLSEPGAFLRDGEPAPDAVVDPQVIWATLDGYATLLPIFFDVALKSERPPWLQLPFAGVDQPVCKRLMAHGVRLTKGRGQSPAIAEFIVAHALSLIVPIGQQAKLQAEKTWAFTPWREVSQTRWTLIGYGAIGEAVARRIKPFGAHLTVVRRSSHDDGLADAVIGLPDLPTVLPHTDVLVLACALTDETRGVANEGLFAALKPGAILINIGRGGLVDEDALLAGLERDQPAHAVLDVFNTEPLPADSPLWTHPKVRVSGHTSHDGDGKQARTDAGFLENLALFRAGRPLIGEAALADVGLEG